MEIFLKLIAFAGFLLVFCSPGLPFGLWLCGRDIKKHPEALVYGFVLGHFLSSGLMVSLVYLFGFSRLSIGLFIGLVIGWLVISLRYQKQRTVLNDEYRMQSAELIQHSAFSVHRLELPTAHRPLSAEGKLPFKPWNRQSYILFSIILLVTAVLVFEPFANLGKKTDFGYAYRKYFPGDFLKQVAITAELSRGEIPPQNPWVAGETLHYYWWYFTPPAVFYRITKASVSIQNLIVVSILLTDVVFLFALFSTLRLFTRWQLAPFLTALIGITSYSYEGIHLWWELQPSEKPSRIPSLREDLIGNVSAFLEQSRSYNMDGLTRWFWGDPQMDGLFRSLLYSPQHLQTLTLLLAVLSIFTLSHCLRSFSLSLMAGWMVGISVGYSVFVGMVIGLWYGICLMAQLLLDNLKTRSRMLLRRSFFAFLLSGCLAVFLVLLTYSLSMFVNDPDTGLMVYTGKALKSYGLLVFFMNYGPPLIFGVSGILLIGKKYGSTRVQKISHTPILPYSHTPILPVLLLLLLAVTLVCTVALKGFLSDVGLKLGLVIEIALLIFSAIFLEYLYQKWPRPILYLLLTLICSPALITVLIDRTHLSDIYNPEFTVYIPKEDMEAATWIKRHLPRHAIVQSSSPESEIPFTLIPIMAERRTAIGDRFYDRIFQIPQITVDRRKRDIARLFDTNSLTEAMDILKKYQIHYVYLGESEKESFPFGIQKFYGFPKLFEKAYENSEVTIFKVQSYEPELLTLDVNTPISLNPGENQTISVVLSNEDRLNSHIISLQAAVESGVRSPDSRVELTTDGVTPDSGLRTPDSIRLAKGERKTVSVPLPPLLNPGTYSLILQASEETTQQVFSIEAEAFKGNLGKVQEDSEAFGRKAVFVEDEGVPTEIWAFFLDRKFPPGHYTLSLRVKVRDNGFSDKIFTWEAVSKEDRKQMEIPGTAFQEAMIYQNLSMDFGLIAEDALKLRINYHGKTGIWIDLFELTLNRKNFKPLIARKVYPSGIQVRGND